MARRSPDARAAEIAAALAPYGWRDLTARMLARQVVGAVDRHAVTHFLAGLSGTRIGPAGPVEPADRGDERVDVLVRFLGARHWRGLSLDRVCVDLVRVLEGWQAERDASPRSARGPLGER
ncbi:hypothetical protein [Geodermatophilus sp. SYSU D00696]